MDQSYKLCQNLLTYPLLSVFKSVGRKPTHPVSKDHPTCTTTIISLVLDLCSLEVVSFKGSTTSIFGLRPCVAAQRSQFLFPVFGTTYSEKSFFFIFWNNSFVEDESHSSTSFSVLDCRWKSQ